MVDQPGTLPADPGGTAGLGEVLTGEAAGDDVDLRERPQFSDIGVQGDVRHAVSEYREGGRVDLAEQLGVMTGRRETLFDPTDPGEQPDDAAALGHATPPPGSTIRLGRGPCRSAASRQVAETTGDRGWPQEPG